MHQPRELTSLEAHIRSKNLAIAIFGKRTNLKVRNMYHMGNLQGGEKRVRFFKRTCFFWKTDNFFAGVLASPESDPLVSTISFDKAGRMLKALLKAVIRGRSLESCPQVIK